MSRAHSVHGNADRLGFKSLSRFPAYRRLQGSLRRSELNPTQDIQARRIRFLGDIVNSDPGISYLKSDLAMTACDTLRK